MMNGRILILGYDVVERHEFISLSKKNMELGRKEVR